MLKDDGGSTTGWCDARALDAGKCFRLTGVMFGYGDLKSRMPAKSHMTGIGRLCLLEYSRSLELKGERTKTRIKDFHHQHENNSS